MPYELEDDPAVIALREQVAALEKQLATQEMKLAGLCCQNGALLIELHDLKKALATVRRAVWAELRTAISNGKFIPLDTSFKTKEMFEIIHWIEAYIDEQAKEAQP